MNFYTYNIFTFYGFNFDIWINWYIEGFLTLGRDVFLCFIYIQYPLYCIAGILQFIILSYPE